MAELETGSFLHHLEALRRTLLACLAACAVALPFGLALARPAAAWLVRHVCPPAIARLHYFSPLEAFATYLRVGSVLALVFAYPFIAHRLWRFVLPALHAHERRALRLWIALFSLLLASGAAFCLGVVLPFVMRFSAAFASDELAPVLGLADFVGLAGALSLAFGLMFQVPIAVVAAVRLGLVGLPALRRARPYALIAVLVVAAILTPPDVISQIALAAPTWLLFELGLLLAARPPLRGSARPASTHSRESASARDASTRR